MMIIIFENFFNLLEPFSSFLSTIVNLFLSCAVSSSISFSFLSACLYDIFERKGSTNYSVSKH